MSWAHGPESSSMALYFEEDRQVAVPVERQTTTVFGRVHQNASPGLKSTSYDCLVCQVE